MSNKKIIHIHFFEPQDGETDFYFGCLKAIYEMFPPSLIGLKYDSLVNNFAKRGYRIDTPTCVIRAGLLRQKRRANKAE